MWFDAYPGGPLFYLQLLYFQKKGKDTAVYFI